MKSLKQKFGTSGQLDHKIVLNKHLDRKFLAVVVFLSCFLLSFLAGSLIIQPQGTKAVTGLGLVGSPTISLSTGSSAVNLNITPTQSGTMASASQSLTATTNVPTGYNLALSTPDAPSLTPTSSAITSPTALTNNTWGYALARTGAVGVMNDFDSSYAIPTPSIASKWANPSAGSVIKNTSTAATSDTTDIYYGAKVDATLPSGTYENTVRYTATANLSNIQSPTITSIAPSSGSTAGDTAITIVGTGFAANDESVTTAVTIGGAACTSVSISSNTPTTGRDTIYCNTPAHATGAVNVAVTTWSNTATSANGYTYIAPAKVTFVSPSQASTIAGTESGPAFTIVGTGFTGATSVTIGGTACTSFQAISDTHIFCKAPSTINTAGNKAIAVTKTFGTGITNGTSSASVTYSSTAYPTLQSTDAFSQCSTTAKLFRDERDSQLYYAKMMPDQKCWMVDNLKYANYGNLSQEDGKYLTANGTPSGTSSNLNAAKYVDPGAASYCTGITNMPINTNTRCGLLYNWYTATNGTGTGGLSTVGMNVSGSICPANFRLPSSTSDGTTATGNGTSYSAADFAVLNASMNAGALSSGDISNFYAGWQPSGAWGGTFSGYWLIRLGNQGSSGGFWSSTVYSATDARYIYFLSGSVGPGGSNEGKYNGRPIRCVMEGPMTPPAGSNPNNISSTNPAVIDVYPTTGWEGDVVAITSNGLFSSDTTAAIGNTDCTKLKVISSSLVTCKLPAMTAGTSQNISVWVSGKAVLIIEPGQYAHMNITYFNPNLSTVSIGGTSYNFYANGFTSANCSAMTASNAAIGTEPAASLAYVRDPRNKQTYRVKKMVDNKCWMVDNLKYIDTTIANVDGTAGMVYNQGDHLGNGGSTAYNTVDESSTYNSAANINKAFYNNPMGNSYCYGTTNMPANTLTGCGYLYNWYAATDGTGTYAQSTQGTNVAGNICPANFRLPSVSGNDTYFNTADFAILNASMNAGTLTTGSTTSSYYAGWRPSGAWGGAFSGAWDNNGLDDHGIFGHYWSSTVAAAAIAYFVSFTSYGVGLSNNSYWYDGYAVRCALP